MSGLTLQEGQFVKVEHETIFMEGGWDLLTPGLRLYAGSLRDVQNFDVAPNTPGGYSRCGGYERFDGRPSPSSASYSLIQVTAFTNVPTVGQTLTGFTSGATGVIIGLVTGSLYIVLSKVTGTFTSSEVVKVGATVIGTATPLTTMLTSKLNAQYIALAADLYRTDILTVPGSGAVRGVVAAIFSGTDIVYAFRNNAGGTAVDLYKSTTGGWVQVPFYNEVSFTAGGGTEPVDGATLTQGANTATVKRVVLQSGSWAGASAAGRFIITTPAPGNFAGGAATLTAAATTVTLTAIQTAITLAPGGTFEFDVDNFTGLSTTRRIYGCDGANRGFEFDGDTLVPITTGFSPDTPTHVKVHALHLAFAFASSLGLSAIGFPYKWSAVDGAAELAAGDRITNLVEQIGGNAVGAMIVTTFSDIKILYGTGLSSWNLIPVNAGVGGVAFTAQQLNQGYWLTGEGVMDIRTAQEFGNFKQATLTNKIQDYIIQQRTKVTYSVLNRSKNQFRIFFNDATALIMTLVNGKVAGITKHAYAGSMFCAWSSAKADLTERVFYGSSTGGYVFQADVGSSFDGAVIDAYLVFAWYNAKAPRFIKVWRRLSIEMQSNFYASFDVGYSLAYNSTLKIQPPTRSYDSAFSGALYWDAVSWDSASWDGITVSPSEIRIKGSAVNIQYTIHSGTNYVYPYTINTLTSHYSYRRAVR